MPPDISPLNPDVAQREVSAFMALIVAVIVKQIFSDYIVTSNSSSHMSLALEAESKLPFFRKLKVQYR